MGEADQFGDREDRAGFVVGPHHGHDRGVFIDLFLHELHVEPAAADDRRVGDLVTAPGKLLAVREDAGMLDAGGHDLFAFRLRVQRGVDRGIVALSPATGEDDFGRDAVLVPERGSEQVRDPAARLLDIGRDAAAEAVDAGRIAVPFAEERLHGDEDLRVDAGGRIIIQIDHVIHQCSHFP